MSVVLRGCTVSVLSLAHAGVCLSVLQKCQILSANDDLDFPAPARGALLPPGPVGARIQPLPFAPPPPFGRPALERLAQQAARGTLLYLDIRGDVFWDFSPFRTPPLTHWRSVPTTRECRPGPVRPLAKDALLLLVTCHK
jgi:hypothetical protein